MELPQHNDDDDMAAAVVDDLQQQPQSGPKRYRPAPAKTFQCRGYGECRMVFSRSEHLARHIRKHTGERPFTCHCSKQFSRLDNLRQHAQTVHADKQDQNERMMRDLTSLHASMAAANKLSTTRSGRRPATSVKQEQRPGTSTGYEGDHNSFLYQQNSYSFRDSSQSFLAPAAGAAPGQSFLPVSSPFRFPLPDSNHTSRPHTASNRSLPPLAAVVSNALAPERIQSFPGPILPGPLALRRPTTATRPGTAPASASFFSVGFSRSDLSLQSYGRTQLGDPPSPVSNDPSPFFFSPPAIDPSPTSSSDYGSESRPQSRRLSLMELCNDNNVLSTTTTTTTTNSRPTTSNTLVSSASALALVDRPSPTLSAGRLLRRNLPSPTTSILSTRNLTYSPTFSTAASTASYSPTSSTCSSRSPLLGHDGPTTKVSSSRRSNAGPDDDSAQIRFSASSHASTALGLRV